MARYIARDQYHEQALRRWEDLGRQGKQCVTSNFVLDETFTLLGRRAGYGFAADRAKTIYASNILSILRPAKSEEIEAVYLFKKYADHAVSYTDCISFVLMRKEKIKTVFSFDNHFVLAGFNLLVLNR